MPALEKLPDLLVHTIVTSSYNQRDGRLRQYGGTMMLPPVFAVLDGLIEQEAERSNISASKVHWNERTQRGNEYLKSIICSRSQAYNTVAFISSKSFELSRAIDVAMTLKGNGVQPILGGAGITLADCATIDYVRQKGITVNIGEGELTVGEIIQDAVNNRLKPVYWQKCFVDMRNAPLPKLPEMDEHKLTMTKLAAIGTSEGCPFNCSYCCVVKLRGHEISPYRSRDVNACVVWLEAAFERGFENIMLTDDNFRKSATYEALKEPLKNLNERLFKKNSRELNLFVQLDVKPDIITEIRDLAEMGVKGVFVGMESNDPAVLAISRKKQNKPEKYQDIVDEFHKYGIMVSSGAMIGFPNQTPESIYKDLESFAKLLDLAHPFIVTPIPGSDDWVEAVRKDQLITWDPNAYDGTRCVRNWLKYMTPQELEEIYRKSFLTLFPKLPKKDLTNGKQFSLLGYQGVRNFPGRRLAELGQRIDGRPWQLMMDGLPSRLPLNLIPKRPTDSFSGIPLSSYGPIYQSPQDYKDNKERFLSKLC